LPTPVVERYPQRAGVSHFEVAAESTEAGISLEFSLASALLCCVVSAGEEMGTYGAVYEDPPLE